MARRLLALQELAVPALLVVATALVGTLVSIVVLIAGLLRFSHVECTLADDA